ncbi:MAG TPA: TIGR03118 family protein [Bryobacterales bacterium]|jgi:uncharacterized protein (TIGR03118 family)|nr:TIGR03118 family protein [Bryobacterales bacterium]
MKPPVRKWTFAFAGLAALILLAPALGAADATPTGNAYLQHNLVADTPGIADHTDPNLIDAWGISESAASPFWVSDHGAGLSTLYNSTGVPQALKVIIPAGAASGSGAAGKPTGQVQNSAAASGAFAVATGRTANFIFATEDGTISGWNANVDATHAIVKVDNSTSGAVYKGLALGTPASGARLYAANFSAGTIDVFDANFNPVTPASGAFTDAQIPAGFAPFNIQNLGGKLYVTYAKQDSDKVHDVAGLGNGYVDVFDLNGTLLQRLAAGGPLNSPWGVAIAPANFGPFSNDVLVGNFGDGKINAFDPATGAFLGALQDPAGNVISIPGLWGLQPGNGGNGGDKNAVYFAAGPGGEKHGLFGSLQASPVITASGIVNSGSSLPVIAQNTWITIFGANLAATNRAWASADFSGNKLPTSLDGVSVMINGKPAYVGFISPSQLNVLTPLDATLGPVPVQVTNNGLTSAAASVSLQPTAPAFFMYKNNYIAAVHSDNVSIVGPAALFPNASTPAKPGETIVMYGTGFGPTNPPIPGGTIVSSANPLISTPIVMFAGIGAQVIFGGLTGAGLYQFNVVVPPSAPDGDLEVQAVIGGVETPPGTFINVKR